MTQEVCMAAFFAQVYELVSRIPAGKVGTYGQIAGMLGDLRRARTVGWAMAGCPEELPWHRMVKSDGSLPNPNFAELQRAMLESEGIVFLHNGRIDMKLYAWNGES
jgi:methylated-DNA-protein-cysteine methyltransferase-like protein